jgi:choline dehydrogenase-like flavoprotein
MIELGVPIIKDAMGGNNAGAFWYTLSEDPKDESRSTSQTFYTNERPNLHLLVESQVIRVNLETTAEPTATAIEYSTAESDETFSVNATKEVILTAGALHTPQILQLSGIGDERHLSSLGIHTAVDLPGVGANHHDHLLLVSAQSGMFLCLEA